MTYYKTLRLPSDAPFDAVEVTILPSPGNPRVTVQVAVLGGNWLSRALLWMFRGFTDNFVFEKDEINIAIAHLKEGKDLHQYELIRNQQSIKSLRFSIYIRQEYWDIYTGIDSLLYKGSPTGQYKSDDCLEIISEIEPYLK